MSNEEKVLLKKYKENRKIKMIVQGVAILILTLFAIITFTVYRGKESVYYVNYSESSNVDYKVYLKDNDFYEEEYLGKGYAYVASLIDHIETTMDYKLIVDSPDVEFQYSYKTDIEIIIKDNKYNQTIFNKVDVLQEEKSYIHPFGKDLVISTNVNVDYPQYNVLAAMFIDTYDLENVTSSLILTTYVKVTGTCQDLINDSVKQYTISINIPLTTKTTSIEFKTDVKEAAEEDKMLACRADTSDKEIYKWMFIILSIIDIIAIVVLIIYAYISRNKHINYSRKLNKIVSNYKSYIQVSKNGLNFDDCQVIEVSEFTDMLEIRDTIQKPILMEEDADNTWARFIIPATEKLIYMYQMSVEDFEEKIEEDEEI